MTTPVASFKTGLQVAIEDSEAVAPGLSSNAYWFQGGRWFDIVTSEQSNLGDRQPNIFPSGAAGRRAMNVRAPVIGRQWSDGDMAMDISSDLLPLFAYAAMGTLSTNRVNSTDFDLLTDEPLEGGQLKQLVLTNQPSDGGAILRFLISGASAGGTISISGIDVNGNGASEIISFSSAGSLYTRTSFSSIAASGIEISGSHAGTSVTINGIQYWEHIISFNNTSNPRLSILRYGDPTTGNPDTIRRHHPGMVVQNLNLENPAGTRDGIFTGTVTVEGYPTATCTAGSLNSVSPILVWPSWTQKITKNGADWFKATNFSMAINSGNRNYRAAAGKQNPQGQVFLMQEVTGAFQILADDAAEYNEWRGASAIQMVSEWTAPWKLTSTQNQLISASMNSLYLENVTPGDEDDVFVLSADFRTIENADTGLLKMRFLNNVPGIAYGNNVA